MHLAAESRHGEETASLLVAFKADLEAKDEVIYMKPTVSIQEVKAF